MKVIRYILAFGILISGASCRLFNDKYQIASPDGIIKVSFMLRDGKPYYSVVRNKTLVIAPSLLGLQFQNCPALDNNFKVAGIQKKAHNETWEQVWGERRLIENKYDEMSIELVEKAGPGRKMTLLFRVFNDGVGFRYLIPEQKNMKSFTISDELTQFSLTDNYPGWWIPAYTERFYESLYRHTTISEIDTICTPFTIEMQDQSCISIHEANLTNYGAMNLFYTNENTLNCDISPWSTGEKVRTGTPFESPWRVIIMADRPGDLITSTLMLNLNEPSKIEDTSWIKPGKYIGIWWSIHQKKHTWSMGPDHGATTQNAISYIDFAAENNFDMVLFEGWNYGWGKDWSSKPEKVSFTEPYPDFDINGITSYAARKGIELIGHHETHGNMSNYEEQLEAAFQFYHDHGIKIVKTGYVNDKLDGKEFHSSQYGVTHFRKVLETAAKYQIAINNHEPVMPTGLQRTFPNLMTQEGVRGQEWDAWSADRGNPPDHTTIVPFTRGLAGPIDFTFGTFNFENPVLPDTKVRTTLAKQVALYMIIYSPLQMASDLPENYLQNAAFEFIKTVPVDWEETKVLAGQIGDYIVTARKDRKSSDWFLGAISDEELREIKIELKFLPVDKEYKAVIIADASDAHYESNPTAFRQHIKMVNSGDIMHLRLAPGGGQAIHFSPVK